MSLIPWEQRIANFIFTLSKAALVAAIAYGVYEFINIGIEYAKQAHY